MAGGAPGDKSAESGAGARGARLRATRPQRTQRAARHREGRVSCESYDTRVPNEKRGPRA